jgi:DNA-binding FadR family transcriptional regulator
MDMHYILRAVPKQPLARRVADTIKRYILSENLAAGDALPTERQLAESLVVSRTVVREALGILMGAGLITKEAGRGVFVLPFDRETVSAGFALTVDEPAAQVSEMIELRRVIEVGALRLAVERITPAQVGRLRELVALMRHKQERGENFAAEDAEFHILLLQASGNSLIGQFRYLVEELMRRSIERNPRALREIRDERSVRIMAAILEALVAGDVTEARRLMEDEHLKNIGESPLTEAGRLRAVTAAHTISAEELTSAKAEGRP